MNAELDTTDHPFGAVVKALGFHRRTITAQVLISANGGAAPANVLRHQAVLETPDSAPFSLVVETYTNEVLSDGSAGR
jgi:hypothetical protein